MDLPATVFASGDIGLRVRCLHNETAERHGMEPLFLASGVGFFGFLGAFDVIDWAGLASAVEVVELSEAA